MLIHPLESEEDNSSEGEDEEDLAHLARMEILHVENARLRAINAAEDEILRREIAERGAVFSRVQDLEAQIREFRSRRDEGDN